MSDLKAAFETYRLTLAKAAAVNEICLAGPDDGPDGPRFAAYEAAMKAQFTAQAGLRAAILEAHSLDPSYVVGEPVAVKVGHDLVVVARQCPDDHSKDCLVVVERRNLRRVLSDGSIDMLDAPDMTPEDEREIDAIIDAIIADIQESLPILSLVDGSDRESQDRHYDIIMAEVKRRLEECSSV